MRWSHTVHSCGAAPRKRRELSDSFRQNAKERILDEASEQVLCACVCMCLRAQVCQLASTHVHMRTLAHARSGNPAETAAASPGHDSVIRVSSFWQPWLPE
jgi:hypothetical protein